MRKRASTIENHARIKVIRSDFLAGDKVLKVPPLPLTPCHPVPTPRVGTKELRVGIRRISLQLFFGGPQPGAQQSQ